MIAMVDSNLQREHILPSEKAFAYKMKLEALNHQGKKVDTASTPVVSKLRTNEIVGQDNGDSREQVRCYIRLTELVPELLELVDDGRMAFRPAVEISYLTEDEQRDLVETIDSEDCTFYSVGVGCVLCASPPATGRQGCKMMCYRSNGIKIIFLL